MLNHFSRSIEAELPPFREPCFRSPQEAIDHQRNSVNASAAMDLLRKQVVGRRMLTTAWSDTELLIELEDADSLRAYCSDGVHLELFSGNAESLQGSDELGESDVQINLGKRAIIWSRKKIANRLRGDSIFAVTLGVDVAFISMARGPAICISTLLNRQTSKEFLFWDRE